MIVVCVLIGGILAVQKLQRFTVVSVLAAALLIWGEVFVAVPFTLQAGGDLVVYSDALAAAQPTTNQANTITLTVDVTADRKPISPDIYGINFADEGLAQALDLPVDRWGGNSTSRYNWQTDISNHASDWYFENIKETNATDLPADSWVNRFIAQDRRTGTDTILTMPMSGYVSNDNDLACSFKVSEFGAQQRTDVPWRPNCGNGVRTNGTPIAGNNPLDTSIAVNPSFVTGWINDLTGRYGNAGNGGVRFYALDNEPDLWFETHRDVAPIGLEIPGIPRSLAAIRRCHQGRRPHGPDDWAGCDGMDLLLAWRLRRAAPGLVHARRPHRQWQHALCAVVSATDAGL